MTRKGIRMYMVTTVLKLSDITSPSIFAEAQQEKSTNQYWNHMPRTSVMLLPTRTKVNAWIAEITNCTDTLERR